MSYNIHSGIGQDGKYRLERIIELLREETPDFVALQEVDWGLKKSSYDNQPERLSQELNMYAYFCMMRVIEKGTYGILTLSRFPIVDSEKYDLSYRTDIEPRGLSRSDVDMNSSGHLHVYNIHLGLRVRERQHQRRLLLSETVLLDQNKREPKILMGDFNDRLVPVVHGKLRRHFTDVFSFLRIRNDWTFRWKRLQLRLDHIYVSEHFRPQEAYIIRSPLAHIASDHYPLVGILKLKKQQ
jgi:endonuclease/exonuclease/phosphatase family metal-dependent hydrolase